MRFPYHFQIFGLNIHAHLAMEVIAYSAGFQLYIWLRRRWRAGVVPFEQNAWVIVACILGALVGSKVLAWAESPWDYWPHRYELAAWIGGKTIVGGLLGGWIGVELAKRGLGIRQATGDLYVFPLIVGMCLGRVGCFLTGLDDHTHGIATSLPWGVDFGDGIRRHPTQLYEVVFLAVLGVGLAWRMRWPYANGAAFRWFMAGYLGFRFGIEFIKPRYHPYFGMSMIQVVSVVGVGACVWSVKRMHGQDARATGAGRAAEEHGQDARATGSGGAAEEHGQAARATGASRAGGHGQAARATQEERAGCVRES